MSQQSLRQASFRTKAGTVGTYDSDLMACSAAVTGVAATNRNGAEILLLQSLLTSVQTGLSALQAEYAASVNASSWQAVGTMVIP